MDTFIGIMSVIFMMSLIGNICFGSKKNKQHTSNLSTNNQNPIKKFKRTSFSVHNYYGGYDDIMDIKQVGIGYDEEGYFFLKFFTQEKKIPIGNIIEVSTKTEQEIKEAVSLGRSLLVGNLAFLWKKNKVTNKKFVIINFLDEEENKERNIIVESKSAELLYKEINNIVKNK